MKKKPGPKPKKQAERFDQSPVDGEAQDSGSVASDTLAPVTEVGNILNPKESAAEFDAAEGEKHGKEKKEKEKSHHAQHVLKHKPVLEKNQKHFETADGRFLAGPIDAGSIDDPMNPGVQVNPWREGSKRLK